jgi:dipeptidyl aminopeptidase/acylaminoacyl peptidase
VYVTDLNKTDDVRITEGHGACRPDWAPDGSKLAYVSQRDSKKANIWIMNPDGSGKHRLTDDDENYDYYPAWSPDGAYVVYAKSPDKDHGNWELYIASADGTQNIRLTNHPAKDKFPDWYGGSLDEKLVGKLTTQQEFVYEAELSPRIIGEPQADQDASGGQVVTAKPAAGAGFLVFGPYAEYAPGNYTVRFRMKIGKTSSKKMLGFVDVAADTGQTILVRHELFVRDFEKPDHYQDVVLEFSVQASQTLEFRIFSQAVATMAVDAVRVQKR